jgi:hypothetical protein
MKIHARKIGILGCIGGVVLLWMGCAGATRGEPKATPCTSGFYDRVACLDIPGGKSTYGHACDPWASSRITGTPDAGEPDWLCGGYLCLSGRCSSCRSNDDCKAFFGAGQCSIVTGPNTMPGAVCWPVAQVIAEYESVRTDPRDVCVANPADAPAEPRLAAGLGCARDCDCWSSFCDRGVCADSSASVDSPAGNYGRGPCKGGSHFEMAIHPDFCGGYVCIEQRCRSCQSDADCRDGSFAPRCLSFPGLPGKQCEDTDEFHLRPGAPRPLPRHKIDPSYE